MTKQVPKYVYFCKECKKDFEIRHSLQKTCTVCEICGHEGQLDRRPSPIFLTKKQSKFAATSEVGEVVKAAIEETKQDLAVEKESLKNREYKK